MGAYAPANVRQRVGLVHLPAGFGDVVVPDGLDILGDVHVGGAGRGAQPARHAAAGFLLRLFLAEALDDLDKGVAALRRRQHIHRLAFEVEQVYLIVSMPALGKFLAVHALAVRQNEEGVRVRADVHVLPRHRQRVGRADVDAQAAPATAAIIDGRPVLGLAYAGFLALDRHHTYRIVVANLGAGAASNALLEVVDMKPSVSLGRGPVVPWYIDGVRLLRYLFQSGKGP